MKNKQISIDSLVTSDNWIISYVNKSTASNVLFLLQKFGEDDNEDDINGWVMTCPTMTFSISSLINQFINKYHETPFIVIGLEISECIKVMDERLRKYTNFDQFMNDAKEFYHWKQVIYVVCTELSKVDDTHELTLLNMAYHEGYESVYKLIENGQVKL